MDEQRAQSMQSLMKQLLGDPQKQELEILRAEAAKQFFYDTLRIISENQGYPNKIYPIWVHQQSSFNEGFLAVLPTVATEFLESNTKQHTLMAAILVVFGDLIQQFPLGQRWLNLELGIKLYQQALTVRTRDVLPVEWAATMDSLATAYKNRILDNRSDNIERAISIYQQALTVRTQDALPTKWATTLTNLSTAYKNRILGNRSDNIEQAIITCQQALTVITQKAMPIEWAGAMNNLALAYSDRIQDDRADNIEQAIAAYQQALTVLKFETMPVKWAITTSNLANAYFERIRGDHANNIEQAITAYQQALTIVTKETMSVEWAGIMNNLALAYSDRIRGNRAENTEQAIAVYQQALTVRNRETMPAKWAITVNNLASAYKSHTKGDFVENIEQAITAYQQALTVMTKDNAPVEWAGVMNNLASAYVERIRGDRANNIEQAISLYQQVLAVRTKENMPVEWAATINNLALAYSDRIRGDRADNIEQAIAAYQQALTVRKQETMPIKWAITTGNLANAYFERIRGDSANNIEQAIAAYRRTLTIIVQENMPFEWAGLMSSLGTAYSKCIQGDREGNIEQAVSAYQHALKVFGQEVFPDSCRRTARNLANLYSERRNWPDAIRAYDKALKAADKLYQSCVLLDSKTLILAETADLHRLAAYAYACSGNLEEAVETLEQGCARGLSESLDRDRANLIELQQVQPNLYTQYIAISKQLRNLEIQQRERVTSHDRHSPTPESLRDSATTLSQELDALIRAIRQEPGYQEFLSLPTFETVRHAVRRNQPLVYLIVTPFGSLALIVTSEVTQSLLLNELTETNVTDLLNNTWFSAYQNSQSNLPDWFNAIDSVTHQLWEPLMRPLIHHLKTHNFDQAILIPTGYLSFLPLHAAWTEDTTYPTKRRYALDDIHFTYAPNAKSLTAARVIADHIQSDSILAIDNPCNDLPNSQREVSAAVDSFSDRTTLSHQAATIAAIKAQLSNHAIAHFSCHGTANLTEPLNSGLLMSDGLLTLKDIFALNLAETGGLRLAILSACETGLQGLENADEAIGLPTGLLQAGVAAVIASLWSVDDLSTMMLLTRFYDLWRTEGLEISQALRQAQQWVRDTTNGEKVAYFKDFMPTQSAAKTPASAADYLYKSLILSRPDARDFAHPFHWAAFSYVGA